MKKKQNDKKIHVQITNVKLTKESYKALKKIKEGLYGNVADSIEGPEWGVPCRNNDYMHMKEELEKGIREMFHLDADAFVEIDSFRTGITSFSDEYRTMLVSKHLKEDENKTRGVAKVKSDDGKRYFMCDPNLIADVKSSWGIDLAFQFKVLTRIENLTYGMPEGRYVVRMSCALMDKDAFVAPTVRFVPFKKISSAKARRK